MEDKLKDMSLDQLLDLLSQYTTEYISLVHREASRIQHDDCTQMLKFVQKEIEGRKKGIRKPQ